MKVALVMFAILNTGAAIMLASGYAGNRFAAYMRADLPAGVIMSGGEVVTLVAGLLAWLVLSSFIFGIVTYRG